MKCVFFSFLFLLAVQLCFPAPVRSLASRFTFLSCARPENRHRWKWRLKIQLAASQREETSSATFQTCWFLCRNKIHQLTHAVKHWKPDQASQHVCLCVHVYVWVKVCVLPCLQNSSCGGEGGRRGDGERSRACPPPSEQQAGLGGHQQAGGPHPSLCVCSWLNPRWIWLLPELSLSAMCPPSTQAVSETKTQGVLPTFLHHDLHFAGTCGSPRAKPQLQPGVRCALAALHLPFLLFPTSHLAFLGSANTFCRYHSLTLCSSLRTTVCPRRIMGGAVNEPESPTPPVLGAALIPVLLGIITALSSTQKDEPFFSISLRNMSGMTPTGVASIISVLMEFSRVAGGPPLDDGGKCLWSLLRC